MGRLDGRIAIITGAGRGLGRAHALHFARAGAQVVVNDLGVDIHGMGTDDSPARQVVREIEDLGGRAVASHHDITDWEQAGELVELAISSFGDLHVLVNNAGVLRDRAFANMTENEWDTVIRVHLKGHAAPAHHAVAYWRSRAKAGETVQASVIHTSSLSGLFGNFGQANYAAAKLAVVALSRVIALEAARYGVRSNAVSPSARTRMVAAMPAAVELVRPPDDPDAFDAFHPGNVSPVLAWLAEADCPATSQVFQVIGSKLYVFELSHIAHELDAGERWTAERLDEELRDRLVSPTDLERFLEA